ncbi:MAG TPA: hypothetical protein VGM37_09055 [Armatimonadota bacterium]|jgi:hypothetical protein
MNRHEYPARVGGRPGRIEWVAWGGRRVMVRQVVCWWDEPPLPWDGVPERHYARLLLETGGVLEVYHSDENWRVCGLED